MMTRKSLRAVFILRVGKSIKLEVDMIREARSGPTRGGAAGAPHRAHEYQSLKLKWAITTLKP